jgi:hypothetical protein
VARRKAADQAEAKVNVHARRNGWGAGINQRSSTAIYREHNIAYDSAVTRALGLLLAVLVGGPAWAEAALQAPRWRWRTGLTQGFGGGRDAGATVARFPTTLELGARVWGPLSLDVAGVAVQSGEIVAGCAPGTRPNALFGAAGVRADLFNDRSAPWIDPFVEVHAGVGAQSGAGSLIGQCVTAGLFGTAGTRVGFDVWLGRAAVTVALAYDYLPVGSTLSLAIGASFLLH